MLLDSPVLDTLKSKYGPNSAEITDLPRCISSERIAEVLCILLQYIQVFVTLAVMVLNS